MDVWQHSVEWALEMEGRTLLIFHGIHSHVSM